MLVDERLDDGDLDGQATWKRVLAAVEELQSKERPRIAQVAMIGGGGGVVPDGLPDQFHGGSVIAGLMGDHAQQMIGVGVILIELENLPVGGFRVGQPPGLMRSQPFLKKGLDIAARGSLALLFHMAR